MLSTGVGRGVGGGVAHGVAAFYKATWWGTSLLSASVVRKWRGVKRTGGRKCPALASTLVGTETCCVQPACAFGNGGARQTTVW